jgi:hypothetical protein
MYRVVLVVLLLTVATVTAYSSMKGGAVRPESALAHQDCHDFWQHSGHTANARWYHCHNWQNLPYQDGSQTLTRVHICGYSGTLHGVTVGHIHRPWFPDRWESGDHAHDVGGEGC